MGHLRESRRRSWRRLIVAAGLLGLTATPLQGQSDDADEARRREIDRMVELGLVDSLAALFRGSALPDELRLIARAQTNKALRLRDPVARQGAFEDAYERFRAWLNAIQADKAADPRAHSAAQAAAAAELGGMILSTWATSDLDEFEISAGMRGDRERVARLLERAREHLEQADAWLKPLADELSGGGADVEDRYLTLGIYDLVRGLELDIDFQLGWTNLYLAMVCAESRDRRARALRAAEQRFQALIDAGATGASASRVTLGLAMTLREQGQFDESQRLFRELLPDAGDARGASESAEGFDAALAARVRYERARGLIAAGLFEEARVVLRPLVEKNPDQLAPAERPARFYVNLSHLWDANSYLLEADHLRRMADDSGARAAVLLRAQRAREAGLIRMHRLSGRGASWPAVVRLFVAASVDLAADPATLSAVELLFVARQLAADGRHEEALARLEAAAARGDLSASLAGEVRYELGACYYRLKREREAAAAFDALARSHRGHEKASEAVTLAYQLRARVAEETGRPADYSNLADTLMNLLQNYPEHEKRRDASWWLPGALQSAGRFAEAAEQFGKIGPDSAHWEEAQFRRTLCARLALEHDAPGVSADQRARRAAAVAADLRRYAGESYERSATSPDGERVRDWSAQAALSAAELLVGELEEPQQALDLLSDFERRYPQSGYLGRALAVRIRAYRGLRRFAEGARVVERYVASAPPERAGAVLAALAAGMQEEVDDLVSRGRAAEARELAADSLATFERLHAWVQSHAAQAARIDAVALALTRMQRLAGRGEAALETIARVLARDPRNGSALHLRALLLTEALPDPPPIGQLKAARESWEPLLADPELRTRAPGVYWEARYHYLALRLREGDAADVEKAVRSERAWHPQMGGPPWDARFNALYERALDLLERQGPKPGG